MSLDGPVLPTPAWKAIIEVRNPGQLEQTLERMTTAFATRRKGSNRMSWRLRRARSSGQLVYSVRDTTAGTTVAQYTFADGYMIVAPNQALLLEAIQTA